MRREKDLTECMPTLKLSVATLNPQLRRSVTLWEILGYAFLLIVSEHFPEVFVSFPCLRKKKRYRITSEAYRMEQRILVVVPATLLLNCEGVRKEYNG